jgi:hypothetical protein
VRGIDQTLVSEVWPSCFLRMPRTVTDALDLGPVEA